MTGLSLWGVRINLKNGKVGWCSVEVALWRFHPTDSSVDVAIAPFKIPKESDLLMIPLSIFMTPKMFQEYKVGVGDEVIVTGLFKHHQGRERNVPIIRIGNLAALDEEKIATKDFGPIAAYLIEARSIGGISGSPVFVNLGYVRKVNGHVKMLSGEMIFLIGLVHGHFDQSSQCVDHSKAADEQINTGIAIIVPYYKILETLGHPDFIAYEKTVSDYLNQTKLPLDQTLSDGEG